MDFTEIELDKVLKYTQPTNYIVDSTDYDNDFETPVLTAGKNFLLGYTDEKQGQFKNVPAIIFDDFTTSFHYVDFPFKVKSSALKILNARSEQFDIKYIYYLMKGVKIDTELHKRYWISRFSKKTIPFPTHKSNIRNPKSEIENISLTTQKLIAEILDNAAALRDKTQKLLDEYDQLAQSIFLDMFGDPVLNPKGWEISKLKKITSKIGSGSTPRGGKESYHKEGISLVRSLNIHDNKFKLKDLAFIDVNQAEKLKNVTLEESDVLINITGASVARCAIIPSEILPARVNQHVSILRCKQNIINPTFLLHLIISPNCKIKLLGVGSSNAATRESITKEQLETFEVLTPPIELQNQFAEKIALIEQQKALTKQELQESEDLFNCLLQRAFKGELVQQITSSVLYN